MTNECSDCNELELFDDILDFALSEIRDMLFETHNLLTDMIDDYQKHGGMQDNALKNKVEKEILNRLSINYGGQK